MTCDYLTIAESTNKILSEYSYPLTLRQIYYRLVTSVIHEHIDRDRWNAVLEQEQKDRAELKERFANATMFCKRCNSEVWYDIIGGAIEEAKEDLLKTRTHVIASDCQYKVTVPLSHNPVSFSEYYGEQITTDRFTRCLTGRS